MNSSSRNGAKVVWLAVHTTEGIMRAKDLRDWKSWAGSSHAANDETGVLMTPADGFVPYDRASWTLRSGNPISENIEQCGWARWTRAEWLARPKLLDTTAQWLASRSMARGIPLRLLTPAEIRGKRTPGVLGHGHYSTATGDGTHWDPGPGYPWDVVLAKANAYRNGSNPEDDMPSIDEIFSHPIPLRPETREAMRAAGNEHPPTHSSLGDVIAWLGFDYRVTIPRATATETLNRRIDREPGQGGGTTSVADEMRYNATNFGQLGEKVAGAVASQDPEALATALKDALGDQLAADVATRLTVATRP